MNDKLEKTLKELLPYIIITCIIFLLLPLFMGSGETAATYIIQIGAFPLTALGCGFFYKRKAHRTSLPLCFVAPLFYAIAALLYGMWRASWITVLIYIVAYFLCGWLGQMLGETFQSARGRDAVKNLIKKPSQRPKRVNVEEDTAPDESFVAEDPEENDSLDTSTTSDDIEAMLEEIHNRKS